MNLAKLVSLGIALLLIQACSHPIEIVGEGDVTSQSGRRNCSLEQFTAADPVCSKNYVYGFDLDQLPAFVPEDYAETYNPVPRAGWHFARWEPYCTTATGPSYDCSFNATAAQVQAFWGKTVPPLKAVFVTQCGDGIPAGPEECDDGNTTSGDQCSATCTTELDTDGDGVSDVADNCPAIANTNQADFNDDGEGDVCDDDVDGDGFLDVSDACPRNPINPCALITSADIVLADDGKDWAQPDLFTNVTWNQINEVCPAGTCVSNGLLNGRDMTGWTWASVGAVADLFIAYGVPITNTVPALISVPNSMWAPSFLSAFRANYNEYLSQTVTGLMRDVYPPDAARVAYIMEYYNVADTDFANTNGVVFKTAQYGGGWFYKDRRTPITDTVTLNGKEWAQVDLFTNISWNQINAACPNGICTTGSVLKGHDMTGWTWASSADLIALYASFGISGGGDQSHSTLWYRQYLECNDPFISGFGGWRFTLNPPLYNGGALYSYLSGTVRDKYSAPWGDSNRTTLFDYPQFACENHPQYFPPGTYADSIDWDLVDDAYTSPNIGGFFYR